MGILSNYKTLAIYLYIRKIKALRAINFKYTYKWVLPQDGFSPKFVQQKNTS